MNIILELRKLTAKWRSTSQAARVEAVEIPSDLGRGHMHGMSDGLDAAADDVDTLLDTPGHRIDPSKYKN